MDFSRESVLFLPCGRGLPPYLEEELRALGFKATARHPTGVETRGSMADAMALNLRLRTAQYVLYLLKDFRSRTPDDLYREALTVPWEDIVPTDEYVSVVTRVDTPSVNNTMYPSLKVKDAIVDRIADKAGARPDSGPRRHRVVVNLFWRGEACKIYLNTSGAKLSDRGYRRIPGKAPLRENLAAGVVMATGYDGTQPLVCPMCGSGALAIEGALMALGRAPGLLREEFAFQRAIGFDQAAWETLREEARNEARLAGLAPAVLSDIDPKAVEAARRNAAAAGLEGIFEFHVCDFADTPVPPGEGILVMNPEYGERLGDARELMKTYGRVGDFLKQSCAGYTAYIFTGNPELAKSVGLRPGRRIPFHNARIECRLVEFKLFAGSRKDFHMRDAADFDPARWKENRAYGHAVRLFNEGQWLKCHEAFEEIWKLQRRGSQTALLMQGLVQTAVAALKADRGLRSAARRLAKRGEAKLSAAGKHVCGVDTGRLAREMRHYIEGRAEKPPRIGSDTGEA